MKYHTIMFATAVAFSGLAVAADDKNAVSREEMSDYQVQCLEDAYGEELAGDQKDAFVKDCVEKKLAARSKAKDKNA